MLRYLIVQLDDTSVSYCHYDKKTGSHNLMSLETLREGIVFAMKHNLHIQYLLPDYELPKAYWDLMDSYSRDIIGPICFSASCAVVVVDGIDELSGCRNLLDPSKRYIVRTTVQGFLEGYRLIADIIAKGISVNVVYVDVEKFDDDFIDAYEEALSYISKTFLNLLSEGVDVSSNLLTDRLVLNCINCCGAGDTVVTLAPDGRLYPCSAFYLTDGDHGYVASIEDPSFPNQNLFKLSHSPLCRECDAYQCKKCVWLNKLLTCEVNVPSHQQCVMAHIERNVSKKLLEEFHRKGILNEISIKDIDYLDPFDNIKSL